MKPPLRSDAGPTAWIIYDQEVARQSLQESLVKNQTLEHLPFLVILEHKSKALIVPESKSRSLSVIKKRSQAISLIPKVIDVVVKKRSPRRRKIMAKETVKPAPVAPAVGQPEAPEAKQGILTKKMWKIIAIFLGFLSAALMLLLVITSVWYFVSCRGCKKDVVAPIIDGKSKGGEQSTAKPTHAPTTQPMKQPTQVASKVEEKRELEVVLFNDRKAPVEVVNTIKGQEVAFTMNVRTKHRFFTTSDKDGVKMKIDGKCITFPFTRQNRINYHIR